MPISKSDILARNFLLGLVRLHILHHAAQEPVFGLYLIRELATHGYSLSPGTLYPLLHTLERDGLLTSKRQVVGGRRRRCYRATPAGRRALRTALRKVRILMEEAGIALVGG